MSLEQHPFNLSVCLHDDLELVKSQAQAKTVKLSYQIDESITPEYYWKYSLIQTNSNQYYW